MKPTILPAALCLVTGLAIGVFVEHRLEKPLKIDCELIDYAQVEAIVARQVKTHAIQPLDIDKIKRVKGFTYAPHYSISLCSQDTVWQQHLNPSVKPN